MYSQVWELVLVLGDLGSGWAAVFPNQSISGRDQVVPMAEFFENSSA
jgi:hypothetical protein